MWSGLLWSHERSARSEKLEGWVGFGTLATREKIEKFGSKQQPNSNILAHEEVPVGAGDEGHGGVPDKPREEKKQILNRGDTVPSRIPSLESRGS